MEKKKVFAFIGSERGKNSVEYKYLKEFLELDYWSSFDIEITTSKDVNLKNCIGCTNCFTKGQCSIKDDDMEEIKKKMVEADVIIISSPVYVHNVSAATKNLIDRIGYWSHIYKLIGKRVIVCSCSGGNGDNFIIAYLKKVFLAMGSYIAGELRLCDGNDYKEDYENVIESLKKSFENPRSCKVASIQNEFFNGFQKKYLDVKAGAEAEYWRVNGLQDYNSFREFFYDNL